MSPFRFFIDSAIGNRTQRGDHSTVGPDRSRRERCSWRLVHKWHELVRETWHGAGNTDSANVWAAANPAHPTTFGHVAVHDGSPATDFDETLRLAILVC